MLKNVKFFVLIQDWLKGYKFRTTQDLIILSSLTTFVELLLQSVYREHEHGIQSELKLKENYFITGLENNLRNRRRKYRTGMEERIKSFEQYVTSVLLTSLKKPCELSSKQIWTSQIKKCRSQRLDSRSRLKNQFRKLVSRSDSKVLSSENELVRKVIVTTSGKDYTRLITRHASLDYNINENEVL
jgi:hypothetical protein